MLVRLRALSAVRRRSNAIPGIPAKCITMSTPFINPTDIAVQVRRALATAPLRGLAKITVRVEGAAVSLVGEVETFYEKQMATECAKRVAKSYRIENSVLVQTPGSCQGE